MAYFHRRPTVTYFPTGGMETPLYTNEVMRHDILQEAPRAIFEDSIAHAAWFQRKNRAETNLTQIYMKPKVARRTKRSK